jgi:hypothetical protein
MTAIKVGGRDITVERFCFAKAMRVITLLKKLQQSAPEISKAASDFRREYMAGNIVELDRVQAKMRFGPQPIFDDENKPMFHEGELLTMASPVDRMTEQDWERSDQTLKIRQEPSTPEMVAAVFPVAYEHAEKTVAQLLGLVIMSNTKVLEYVAAGTLWEEVDRLAADVIAPAYIEDVMELVVVVAETIEGQVMTKVKGLGDRLGKIRRLLTGEKTKTDPSEGSPTSSEPPAQPSTEPVSDSPASSTGPTPEPSSLSPGTPSAPLPQSSPVSAP